MLDQHLYVQQKLEDFDTDAAAESYRRAESLAAGRSSKHARSRLVVGPVARLAAGVMIAVGCALESWASEAAPEKDRPTWRPPKADDIVPWT